MFDPGMSGIGYRVALMTNFCFSSGFTTVLSSWWSSNTCNYANQNVFPTQDEFLCTLENTSCWQAARRKIFQRPKNINEIGTAQARKKKEKRNQFIAHAQNPFPWVPSWIGCVAYPHRAKWSKWSPKYHNLCMSCSKYKTTTSAFFAPCCY